MADPHARQSHDPADLISEIRPLPSDPNMRRVRVGSKTAATLRAGDIEALKIRVGQKWTASLASQVGELTALNRARKTATNLLGRRGYSKAELIERLVKRGHAERIATMTAAQMERDGWLNERAYAEDVIRGTLRRGPAARRMLEDKLQRRKVAGEVAEDIASRAAASQDDRTAALELARRRLATMDGLEPAKVRRRLANLLARRGFDEETIAHTLESLRLQDNDSAEN